MALMRQPFFVVGTGRCGTTMLRNILRAHPHVYIPLETHWIPILFHTFGLRRVRPQLIFDMIERTYMARGRTALQRILGENGLALDELRVAMSRQLPTDGLADVREFMNEFYALLAERHAATIFGDKTPDYGLCMTMLQTVWPAARFLHIYRDGRDVALSMSHVLSFQLLAGSGLNHWSAIALDRQYEHVLQHATDDQPLDRFFDLWYSRLSRIVDEATRLAPGTYLAISYEELLARPTQVLRRIATFLRLTVTAEWLEDATASLDPAPLTKNRLKPEYQYLAERYAADLASLGFAP
jgi:hypothetical protein